MFHRRASIKKLKSLPKDHQLQLVGFPCGAPHTDEVLGPKSAVAPNPAATFPAFTCSPADDDDVVERTDAPSRFEGGQSVRNVVKQVVAVFERLFILYGTLQTIALQRCDGSDYEVSGQRSIVGPINTPALFVRSVYS